MTDFSILMNPSVELFELRIEAVILISDLFGLEGSDWKSRIDSNWGGLIFNRFASNPIKIIFGLTRISLDTDFGMNRNKSDFLGMNNIPKLLPGLGIYPWNEQCFDLSISV